MDKQECQHHSRKVKWTQQEDQNLVEAVQRLGIKSWKAIAQYVHGRSGKQCRERWLGQLNPQVVKDKWSIEEDMELIKAQKYHGNKWSIIATILPGRSPISVKNRWSWLMRHGVANNSEGSDTCVNTPSSPPSVAHTERPGWTYLMPISFNDYGIFGDSFIKFQQTLNIATH